ncbi:MAG: chemotaxis protein CheW [Bacillota bacterium]|nr:chemotaxis protein CheW [Bacillota bacterium]
METQLVVFRLAGEDFGVPIAQVREINRFVSIAAVPKAPPSALSRDPGWVIHTHSRGSAELTGI